MSLNISPAKDGVPIGSYILFSNTRPNEVNAEGKTYLKAGVIAPASQYPDVPSDLTDYLGPLELDTSIKLPDPCFINLSVDNYTGDIYAVENGGSTIGGAASDGRAGLLIIKGTSSTATTDTEYYTPYIYSNNYRKLRLGHAWNNHLISYHDDYYNLPTGYNNTGAINTLSYYNLGNTGSGLVSSTDRVSTGAQIATGYATKSDNFLISICRLYTGAATNAYNYATSITSWTAGTFPVSNASWSAVEYNSTLNIWVVIASGGTVALSSTTGVTGSWTSRTLPSSVNWSAVGSSTSAGLFVAVASNSTSAATSTNGTTWASMTMPSALDWTKVRHGNGLWIAIAKDTASYATSTDGTTWTSRTLPVSAWWSDIIYSTNLSSWFICSNDGKGIYTSTDGITWVKKLTSNAGTAYWTRAWTVGTNIYLYRNNLRLNTQWEYAKSTDSGVTWKRWFGPRYNIIEYVNNQFVRMYHDGANPSNLFSSTSSDFETWTSFVSASAGNALNGINGILYTGTKYLIIIPYYGFSGTWTESTGALTTTNFLSYGTTAIGGTAARWTTAQLWGTGNIIVCGISGTATIKAFKSINDASTWTAITNVNDVIPGGGPYTLNSVGIQYNSSIGLGLLTYQGQSPINFGAYISFDKGSSGEYVTIERSIQVVREYIDDHKVMYLGSQDTGNSFTTYIYGPPDNNYTIKYSYTSAYSPVINRPYSYAYPFPNYITIGSSKYYLCATPTYYNNLLKIGTTKYVENLKTASTGNLNYYMRVK
jgi:hypothetical protein